MKLPSFGIKHLFPKRIWQQIFFILFFFSIIPLVILWVLLLQTSQNALKTTILRDHREIAIHTTGEIEEHIKGARGVLSATASILETLHADPWRQQTVIVELSLKNTGFQRISSVDMDGMEIATSDLGTGLYQRSQEEGFQAAISGRSYLSEVKMSEERIPFMTIAEPIKQMGKVKGVLMADLNLRSVWEIIDRIKIGQLGRAYLIDQKGRIIAHLDKKLVLKNANLKQDQVLQDIALGQTGSFEEIDEKGEPTLTSYASIETLKWGLIITQPRKEAFVFSKKMNAQFWALIALGIPATLIISLILAHYMSLPLRDMIEGTERISQGDFSRTFKVNGRSEFDKLLFSFNRMTQKLYKAQEDEKLSIIGKASTAIAHELKNSLQMVDTFVKLLPERKGDEQFIKEFSDTIPLELDSWNTSLKNMMTFSKGARFSTSELDINGVVQKILLLVKLKARQQNIHLKVDLNEGLPLVMGNEEKLKQVLLNLITNALEATPSGGRITISTKFNDTFNDHDFIDIEIMNTGMGIKSEVLHKIFEPFYSTKSGGLGLGLSISKEIIEHHKGSIKVMSADSKTTSFIIRIPSVHTFAKKITANTKT